MNPRIRYSGIIFFNMGLENFFETLSIENKTIFLISDQKKIFTSSIQTLYSVNFQTNDKLHSDNSKDFYFKSANSKEYLYNYPLYLVIQKNILSTKSESLILFAPYIRILFKLSKSLKDYSSTFIKFHISPILDFVENNKLPLNSELLVARIGFAQKFQELLLRANLIGKNLLQSDIYLTLKKIDLISPISLRLLNQKELSEINTDRFGNLWLNFKGEKELIQSLKLVKFLCSEQFIAATRTSPLRHKDFTVESEDE
jgi:hypothetical protein